MQSNMESAAEFSSINCLLNLFTYQPLKDRRRFFACKVFQIGIYVTCVYLLQIHRSDILYDDDNFGALADIYKSFVSALISLIIIVEPLLTSRKYFAINRFSRALEKLLNNNFRHQQNISKVYKKITRDLNIGVVCFLFCYVIFESIYCYQSVMNPKSRIFYISFLIPTIILYGKVVQLVLNMRIIAAYLNIMSCLIRDLNEDVIMNMKLKSRVYNKITRKKYHYVITMYCSVIKLIENYNESLGISQLTIFMAMNFYLTGDLYWITFSFLQWKKNYYDVYGEY